MLRFLNGVLLLATLAVCSCRNDNPPKIDICLGDGFGGADCILKDGAKKYLKPSELKNAWISNQDDMRAFTSWCYDTNQETAREQMRVISEELGHGPASN